MSAPALNFKTAQGETRFLTAYNQVRSLWPVASESLRIPTSFGSTHVLACGPADGRPLVLLHGFGFGATMWYPNVAALAKDHRVYAVDNLGDMNQSVPERAFKHRRETADWLRELLDRLGIDRATVMGHSYGGWLTLNFAQCAPERVERIVLLAPAASLVPMVKQFYLRVMGAGMFPTVGMVRSFARWCVAPGHAVPEELVQQFAMGLKHYKFGRVVMPDVYTDEELRSVKTPALLLIGDKEVIYDPQAAMDRAARLMPNLETDWIGNAGHGLSLEQADKINERVLRFLSAANRA